MPLLQLCFRMFQKILDKLNTGRTTGADAAAPASASVPYTTRADFLESLAKDLRDTSEICKTNLVRQVLFYSVEDGVELGLKLKLPPSDVIRLLAWTFEVLTKNPVRTSHFLRDNAQPQAVSPAQPPPQIISRKSSGKRISFDAR